MFYVSSISNDSFHGGYLHAANIVRIRTTAKVIFVEIIMPLNPYCLLIVKDKILWTIAPVSYIMRTGLNTFWEFMNPHKKSLIKKQQNPGKWYKIVLYEY